MINIYDKNEVDFSNNGLAVLSDCKSCFINQELNGKYELELEYPIPTDKREKYKLIQPWNVIKADGQLFRIPIQENIQETSIGVKAYANHIFYDLYWEWLETVSIDNTNIQQALQSVVISNKFTIGTSDKSEINSIVLESMNPVQGIFAIQNKWGGELYRDNYNIAIKNNIGQDRGVSIGYSKNILGYNQRTDYTNVATRIKPIGKDGLTIESVNNGSKFLDSPRISNYPFPIVREVKFENETDATSLMAIALNLWGVIDVPEINYNINFVELSKTEQYKDFAALETVNLGDIVTVKHSIFDVDIKLKVIRTKKDVLKDRLEEIELGSMKKSISDYINSLQKNIEDVKQETNDKIDETRDGLENQITDAENRLKLDIQKTNEALNITAQDLRDADNQLNSQITISASELRSDYNQKITSANGRIDSNESIISQQADEISHIVTQQTTQDNQISNAQSSIVQQANQIQQLVYSDGSQNGQISSMQSSITQQANQISLVVSGGSINAANIIMAINNDYSGITISADKVNIQGFVTFSDLQNGTTTISGNCITTGKVNMQYIGGDNIYFDSGGYVNAMGGGIRFGYGNTYVYVGYNGMTIYVGGANVFDVSSGLCTWNGKQLATI